MYVRVRLEGVDFTSREAVPHSQRGGAVMCAHVEENRWLKPLTKLEEQRLKPLIAGEITLLIASKIRLLIATEITLFLRSVDLLSTERTGVAPNGRNNTSAKHSTPPDLSRSGDGKHGGHFFALGAGAIEALMILLQIGLRSFTFLTRHV
jgi:hypothetical protein